MSINDIIGDGIAFFAGQRKRLASCGIDITGCSLSHLAYRTDSHGDYLQMRDKIEQFCTANVENVWNRRPISKLLLSQPLDLGDGFSVALIELIPPPHRALYRMGLEHTGVVIGSEIDAFAERHQDKLSGQQHQSEMCEPWYISFDDHTNVKFYRYSLMDVVAMEGRRFDGFYHVDESDPESATGT